MSGDPNAWHRVACRIINQALRRAFFMSDSPVRRRLWAERRVLAGRGHLLEEQRERLARLNWTLGQGSVYRLPPEVVEWSRRAAAEILAESLAEGRIEPPSPRACCEWQTSLPEEHLRERSTGDGRG